MAAVCNVCKTGSKPSFQCFECDKVMCNACKQYHDVFSSKHQVYELQESLSDISFCTIHYTQDPVYCYTCKTLICKPCNYKCHESKHTIQEYKHYFMGMKLKFQNYQGKIDAKLVKVEEVVAQLTSQKHNKVQDCIKHMTKIETDLMTDIEMACGRKRMNSEEDKILSKSLASANKHLEESLGNKSVNFRELLKLIQDMESKILTHQIFFLPAEIDSNVGTLDITLGRLFTFQFDTLPFKSNFFILGGIHWKISAPKVNTSNTLQITLKAFTKEKDEHFVDYITTSMIFTINLDDGDSIVKTISKTFGANQMSLGVSCVNLVINFQNYTRKPRSCPPIGSPYYKPTGSPNYTPYYKLTVLFDIKDIKYKV